MNRTNGNRWTTKKLQEFIGMWLRDISFDKISEHFGISQSGINKLSQRLRREGVPLPLRRRGHKAARRDRLWTQEEVETLVRMRNNKASTQEIANELHRTFYGVQAMILNLRNREHLGIKKLGNGRARLWDADRLRMAIAGRGLIAEVEEILTKK
jgi:biotin operon repressor